jgi:hypothetical protein
MERKHFLNENSLQLASTEKKRNKCFTFTKHGPFMLAHMVRRIKRREQSLHTNSNTTAISTSQVLDVQTKQCSTSHHKLQVLVHREEAATEVLWSLQVLQYPDQEPRAALFALTRATILRRRIAVEHDDLVDAEDGHGAGNLTRQLEQERCSCERPCLRNHKSRGPKRALVMEIEKIGVRTRVASSSDCALSMMDPATATLTVGFRLGPAFSFPASSSFLCFFFSFLGLVSSSAVATAQASPTASFTFFLFSFLCFFRWAFSASAGFMAAAAWVFRWGKGSGGSAESVPAILDPDGLSYYSLHS